MNEIEKKLVEEFVANEDEIKRLQACQSEIRNALISQAPHKRGDVIKWTETGRTRNVGTWWAPRTIPIKDGERRAVVWKVSPYISVYDGRLQAFNYNYAFHVLKKDGTVGVNEVYPDKDYEWMGEHVELD